jgi:hypothetical protein
MPVISSEIRGGRNVTGAGFSQSSPPPPPPLIIIPSLTHTHLSPTHEVRVGPDQESYYHTLGPLGFVFDVALGWYRSMVVSFTQKEDNMHHYFN